MNCLRLGVKVQVIGVDPRSSLELRENFIIEVIKISIQHLSNQLQCGILGNFVVQRLLYSLISSCPFPFPEVSEWGN